jgi:hypothetical protein
MSCNLVALIHGDLQTDELGPVLPASRGRNGSNTSRLMLQGEGDGMDERKFERYE